jgi:hypothetical protein
MHTVTRTAVLLVLLAFVGAAPARTETVNCTPITSLPFVITVQGVYCFTGDLETDITLDAAIEIHWKDAGTCTKQFTGTVPKTTGFCTFTMPSTTGTYEFHYIRVVPK